MRRRFAILLLVAAAALPAAARSQKPVPQVPAPRPPDKPAEATPATPATAPGQLVFASTAGMIFTPVKPGQEAAFEEVLGKIQEALSKSTDPVRKQQATGWKVYKATEAFQENTLYISVMDPAVKNADYNVFPILQEAYGDVAAREIFEKFRAAHATAQNVSNVTPVFIMSSGKVAAGSQD